MNLYMKLVIQRVKKAAVSINSNIVGAINHGFLIFLGIQSTDTEQDVDFIFFYFFLSVL